MQNTQLRDVFDNDGVGNQKLKSNQIWPKWVCTLSVHKNRFGVVPLKIFISF